MQLVLTKQNGQPDFGKEFGMVSRKGKTNTPLGQTVLDINFEISKLKWYASDKGLVRVVGLKIIDADGNERVNIGSSQNADEFIESVGYDERAIGIWTEESKKKLIRKMGLVVLKQENHEKDMTIRIVKNQISQLNQMQYPKT